ncbi:hypothetical protein LguiA_033428 [Lonicera macranthoides]
MLEARSIVAGMPDVKFSWVAREGNYVAHLLACRSRVLGSSTVWFNIAPRFIEDAISRDSPCLSLGFDQLYNFLVLTESQSCSSLVKTACEVGRSLKSDQLEGIWGKFGIHSIRLDLPLNPRIECFNKIYRPRLRAWIVSTYFFQSFDIKLDKLQHYHGINYSDEVYKPMCLAILIDDLRYNVDNQL